MVVVHTRSVFTLACKKLAAIGKIKLGYLPVDLEVGRVLEKTPWVDEKLKVSSRCLTLLVRDGP